MTTDIRASGRPRSTETDGERPVVLAAVVVYFRTPERLDECLAGLRDQTRPPEQVVVVDNSSAIDASERRPAAGTDWRWVRAEDNLGFGPACNLGARQTAGEYLLFLNADVVLASEACAELVAAAEANSQLAVVGPRLFDPEGEIELSARSFPSAVTGFLGRSSWLTRRLARFEVMPAALASAVGTGGRVDWVSGACMLVRRHAFEQVGGFDEGYWMYWEDADLCRRLRARGWEAMLWPAAAGRHSTGSSGRTERTIEAFHASAGRYYERHVARTRAAARLARVLLGARLKLALLSYRRRAAR